LAFTYIASAGNFTDGTTATTLDATGTLNVAAGDVLVAWGAHEGAADSGTLAFNEDSGGAAFTVDAGDYISHAGGDLHGSFGYLIGASANATFRVRMTTASRPYRKLICLQFRPDSGETVTKDGANEAEYTVDTGTASGQITTTGTDEIVIGACSLYTAANVTTPLIGGVAATAEIEQDNASAWYRILTATMTNGTASADAFGMGALPSIWAIIAFKSVSAGGGGGTGGMVSGGRLMGGILTNGSLKG
jgi:hypothetical protein